MRLDTEQLNALSPADRKRYMELEKLFRSPGWAWVVALAQENANIAYNAAATAGSWAANRIAVGNQSAWLTIATFEESTEQLYKGMVVQNNADKQLTTALQDEEDYE